MKHRVTIETETRKHFPGVPYTAAEKRHIMVDGKTCRKMKREEREAEACRADAYRVLLTRSRQGMVIYVPEGNPKDPTTAPELYDTTYEYLKSIGIDELQ